MSIPRSLSAPEVALPKDERERPNLQRTASAAVVGTWTGAALSASAGIPRHVSSRDSEPEDPFNLGGFFPSGFGISARPRREQWRWLRFGEETSEAAEGSYAGAMTPVSEDEEVPATPRTMLSHDGDAATEAAITQADMLGGLQRLFDALDAFAF
ncbi:hypothetical protein K474DRAFT_1704840 [Panus rudis PR-1116 ss-1]|nr:hypothetical protein K474DRAFT_1704840 [Panus rudis PR-1116 ss-1]